MNLFNFLLTRRLFLELNEAMETKTRRLFRRRCLAGFLFLISLVAVTTPFWISYPELEVKSQLQHPGWPILFSSVFALIMAIVWGLWFVYQATSNNRTIFPNDKDLKDLRDWKEGKISLIKEEKEHGAGYLHNARQLWRVRNPRTPAEVNALKRTPQWMRLGNYPG